MDKHLLSLPLSPSWLVNRGALIYYCLLTSFSILGSAKAASPASASDCYNLSLLADFNQQPYVDRLQTIKDWSQLEANAKAVEAVTEPRQLCTLISTAIDNQQLASVRHRAIGAIGDIGMSASSAEPYLFKIFRDPSNDDALRHGALVSLGRIDAQFAEKDLLLALNDPAANIRRSAVYTLVRIKQDDLQQNTQLVAKLYDLLRNDWDGEVRNSAASVLCELALKNESMSADLVVALTQALSDSAWYVRETAARSLTRLGTTFGRVVEPAVPTLEKMLGDRNDALREVAAESLGELGGTAATSAPALRKALSDPNARVRAAAAVAIGKVGISDRLTIKALIASLDDPSSAVRNQALSTLRLLAADLETELRNGSLSLSQAIAYYTQALAYLQQPTLGFGDRDIDDVMFELEVLKARQRRGSISRASLLVSWLAVITVYGTVHLAIFQIRPLWLLKIDDLLRPLSFELPWINISISARCLVFSRYHPRVLDAWVKKHLPTARERFCRKSTMREHRIHIPIKVSMNGRTASRLSCQMLKEQFKRNLLIVGEGGSGKTSLVCQIAKWAMSVDSTKQIASHMMLAVIIETALEEETKNDPLLEAIQGQVEDLTNSHSAIHPDLLLALLRKRRILVIVDRLSELPESTRGRIRPDLPTFFINALIVTSRSKRSIGQVTKTTLEPARMDGTQVTQFIEKYLTRRGKRQLFSDAELVTHHNRLSNIVGDRSVTPLLAKLYLEGLVAAKKDKDEIDGLWLPNNIPDLMLSYLNELNRPVQIDKIDNHLLHEDAKQIAWECVSSNYLSTTADRSAVIAATGKADATRRLDYLEHQLGLIRTVGPTGTQIRFTLDPLAEYLAGLYLVDQYGSKDELWQPLMETLKSKAEAACDIDEFLSALLDCCIVKGAERGVPAFVTERLSEMVTHNSAIT